MSVHSKTFLQALTAGMIGLVGMTIAGPWWCGLMILGIFLVVWAANTRELIRLERAPCDACGFPGVPPRAGARVIPLRGGPDADGECAECGRPWPARNG